MVPSLLRPGAVMQPECRRVFYSGRVQGVGFRFTAAQVARGFEVTGYVRNLPDGRVELLAEGYPAEVEAFLQAVRETMDRHIRGVDIEPCSPAPAPHVGFTIRYD